MGMPVGNSKLWWEDSYYLNHLLCAWVICLHICLCTMCGQCLRSQREVQSRLGSKEISRTKIKTTSSLPCPCEWQALPVAIRPLLHTFLQSLTSCFPRLSTAYHLGRILCLTLKCVMELPVLTLPKCCFFQQSLIASSPCG